MIRSAHHRVVLLILIFDFEGIVNSIKILLLDFTWWFKSSECFFFLSFLMTRSAHHRVILLILIFDFEGIVNFIKILPLNFTWCFKSSERFFFFLFR